MVRMTLSSSRRAGASLIMQEKETGRAGKEKQELMKEIRHLSEHHKPNIRDERAMVRAEPRSMYFRGWLYPEQP